MNSRADIDSVIFVRSNGSLCTVRGVEIKQKPPLGSVITVKHNGCYVTGTLKRPMYWRESCT